MIYICIEIFLGYKLVEKDIDGGKDQPAPAMEPGDLVTVHGLTSEAADAAESFFEGHEGGV